MVHWPSIRYKCLSLIDWRGPELLFLSLRQGYIWSCIWLDVAVCWTRRGSIEFDGRPRRQPHSGPTSDINQFGELASFHSSISGVAGWDSNVRHERPSRECQTLRYRPQRKSGKS